MVAHNAPFDRRVLRQAYERCNLGWPEPAGHLHRPAGPDDAPAPARARLAALADALGIDVDAAHRALPDAETCARMLCALFPRLCAHATTIREALAGAGAPAAAQGQGEAADRRKDGPTERRLLRAAARPGRLPSAQTWPGPRSM